MSHDFEEKLYQDITDVGGFAMAKAVKTWLHQELQKAREEEREETREILRCISRMVEINATNLENYILGQMPIVQSELDQPNK